MFKKQRVCVFVVGLPGCGKDTTIKGIGQFLDKHHVVSVSGVLREAGYGEMIRQGKLIPCEVTVKALQEHLVSTDSVYDVLNGAPRTLKQAIFLPRALSSIGFRQFVTMHLSCDPEVASDRIAKAVDRKGRPDDDPEIVAVRMAQYVKTERHILSHLRWVGPVYNVSTNRSPEMVVEECVEILTPYFELDQYSGFGGQFFARWSTDETGSD